MLMIGGYHLIAVVVCLLDPGGGEGYWYGRLDLDTYRLDLRGGQHQGKAKRYVAAIVIRRLQVYAITEDSIRRRHGSGDDRRVGGIDDRCIRPDCTGRALVAGKRHGRIQYQHRSDKEYGGLSPQQSDRIVHRFSFSDTIFLLLLPFEKGYRGLCKILKSQAPNPGQEKSPVLYKAHRT